MLFEFKKAQKETAKLRLAFIAPAGGGKTYTALAVACHLAEPDGGKVAVIDTEHGSAAKYADVFNFDELRLTDFNPDTYVAAIKAAEKMNYSAVVIDSLSHAWAGPGGALEMVDDIKSKTRSQASHHGWREVTPKHFALIEAMLQSPCHIIGTMRSKMTHIVENGVVKKIGLQPVQRDGLEYEFDLVGDMEDIGRANKLTISKTRCIPLRGKSFENPGADFAEILREWLKGVDPTRPPPVSPDQLATISNRMPGWCRAQGADPDRHKEKAIETWQTFLRNNYGVATARNLTGIQADDLIGRLPTPPTPAPTVAAPSPSAPVGAAVGAEKEVAKSAPVTAPEPERKPTAEEAVAILATVAANLDLKAVEAIKEKAAAVTQVQIDEIVRLMPAWVAVNGPNPPDKDAALVAWRGMLKERFGVVSATRMTSPQADQLLTTLRECEAGPTAAVFAPRVDAAAPTTTQEAATAAA